MSYVMSVLTKKRCMLIKPSNTALRILKTRQLTTETLEVNLQNTYDLGRATSSLKLCMDSELLVPVPFELAHDNVFRIHLDSNIFPRKLKNLRPDLPREEITESRMHDFFLEQIAQVEKDLRAKKPEYISSVYVAGLYEQQLRIYVWKRNSCRDGSDRKRKFDERVQDTAEKLKVAARKLDVDINEEVKIITDYQDSDNKYMEYHLRKIKEKVIETKQITVEHSEDRKRSEDSKRSDIDASRLITDESWAVSLARLPDKGNSEHAFLVLEGKEGNKSMIWFADFVAGEGADSLASGTGDGKVRIDYHETHEVVGRYNKLLFQGRRKLMNMQNGDRLLHETWSIPKPIAETLIKNIKAQQNKPPKYNILGNSALAASSATSTTNPTGHNCFTFARMMLHNLHDEGIKIPQGTLEKWVTSATSRYLVDKQVGHLSWKVFIAIFSAGAVSASFLPILLKLCL